MQNFYIRKKRPDEEIIVRKLSAAAQKLFLGKQGSRDKEWKAIQSAGGTEPAVRIHRGAAARKIIQESPDRILPSRWHEHGRTWAMISKHIAAARREYSRTTAPNPDGLSKDSTIRISRFSTGQFLPPSTSDVPLALQILASIQAAIWVGDVKAAFTQGTKGQRPHICSPTLHRTDSPARVRTLWYNC